MAAVLSWLSKPFSTHHEKADYLPLHSSKGGHQDKSSTADVVSASLRMKYLRDVCCEKLGALATQRCLASEAEAAALQKPIDEQWALLKEINKHEWALLSAMQEGRDIDFDATFWWNHMTLFYQLPEHMRPGAVASGADLSACEEGANAIRKRQHFQSAPIAV